MCLLPLVSVAVRIVYEYGRCIRVFATFGMEDAYVCLLPLVSVAVRIVYEYGRCIRVFATFGFSCS